MYGDPATVRKILTELGDTWAVVGLSSNRGRAAYGVAQVLQRHGKRVVPVHPKAETVHGEQGYPSLSDIPFPVDVVDVFVNSSLAGAVAAGDHKKIIEIVDECDESGRDLVRLLTDLQALVRQALLDAIAKNGRTDMLGGVSLTTEQLTRLLDGLREGEGGVKLGLSERKCAP